MKGHALDVLHAPNIVIEGIVITTSECWLPPSRRPQA